MKRNILGGVFITGLVLTAVGHAVYAEGIKPVIYDSEQEVELIEVQHIVRAETQQERIIRKIKEVFPEEPRMVQVAWCESRYIPTAIGPTNDYGLFQIHMPSHDTTGYDLFNEDDNLKFARKLYETSGLTPWFASSKCWSK